MAFPEHAPGTAGIGLRLPHLAEIALQAPACGFLEIHPENFLANPHATELLLDIARTTPVSVHTVGLSIGSAAGVDRQHLNRVRALADRLDPVLVSGHLAWSTHPGEYLNDLLPLPYTEETLGLVARHLDEVQQGLGRRYLVENPASYLGFAGSTLRETEFLAALVERTGCGLLCDVSNVHLSAHNMGFDPYAYLDALPAAAIGELHLGGFEAEPDAADPGATLLVDTHSSPITPPVWALYGHAVRRFGYRPTLIEWDNDLPDIGALLAEAARADVVAEAARALEGGRAAAA